MTEEKVEKKLQWHSAFYAGIQIELEEDAGNLIFENEHQLATKPLGVDVLIIKKRKEKPVKKNIGKLFKEHNIVEYKSPDDSLSIDDYYKVMGYACIYKADVQQVDIIKAEEITITFVCKKYPQKLINYLKEKERYNLKQYDMGIYYVFGELFPVQIVVTSRLAKIGIVTYINQSWILL